MGSSLSSNDFKGKRRAIRKQFNEFYEIPNALNDANAYSKREEGYTYRTDKPHWAQAETDFTDAANNGDIVKLAEDENFLIIGNRYSFSKGQYPGEEEKAGMSMIHIFIVPKDNYFNPVSLRPDQAHIIDDGIEFFKAQWGQPEFQEAVSSHQKNAIEKRGRDTNYGLAQAREQFKILEKIIRTLKIEDFTYGFHLWPDNSVPHLHIHAIAMTKECRRYSSRIHDRKTKDAFEVRDEVSRRVQVR